MNIPNKISIPLLLVIAGVTLLAMKRFSDANSDGGANEKRETESQRQKRNETEAKLAFTKAMTNDVVGYYRTIKEDAWIGYGTSPSNWWASATVEFINKVGGIERTQLCFRFKPSFGDVSMIRMSDAEFLIWSGAQTR